MTISSYSELLTAVADWTKRSDMTSRIPLFVSMGESAMNAKLRLRIMQATDSLTLSTGNDYSALPSRFLKPVSLVFTSSADVLTQVPRDELDAEYCDTAGKPMFYAYAASQIDFDRTADQNYALTLRYVKRLDIAHDNTNEVLEAAPGVYLYGALQSYARWIEDSEQLNQYTALFQNELKQLVAMDNGSRGVAKLSTDLPLIVQGQ